MAESGVAVECFRPDGQRLGVGRAVVRAGSGARIATCQLTVSPDVAALLRADHDAGGGGSVRVVLRFGKGDERVLAIVSCHERAVIGVLDKL